MGPSGIGKSTLLDILSGRKNTGKVTGELLYSGNKPSKQFLRRFTGYVEQRGECCVTAGRPAASCQHDRPAGRPAARQACRLGGGLMHGQPAGRRGVWLGGRHEAAAHDAAATHMARAAAHLFLLPCPRHHRSIHPDSRASQTAAPLLLPAPPADTMVPVLTVFEFLMYSAELKLDISVHFEEKKAIVERTIDELGLSTCRNVIIGNDIERGISGGGFVCLPAARR